MIKFGRMTGAVWLSKSLLLSKAPLSREYTLHSASEDGKRTDRLSICPLVLFTFDLFIKPLLTIILNKL